MSRRSKTLLIIGVLILSSLSCSLSKCTGQQSPSDNNADSNPQEIVPLFTEEDAPGISPEETEEVNNIGRILFSDAGGLYFLDVQTLQSHQIVAGDIRSGKISPDGKYLAYLVNSDDPESWKISNLSVMDLETGLLLDTSGYPEDANTYTWSKDPGVITFARRNYNYCAEFVDRNITGLYQYNVLTRETTPLHIGTDQYIFWVETWSPDGRYLLFSHGPDCSEGSGLMYYDSQTGDIDGVPFAEASWAPAGGYLVANDIWYWEPEALPLVQYHIFTGEQVELFFEPNYYVSNSVWSPDGAWIAFTRASTDSREVEPLLLNIITGDLVPVPVQDANPRFWNPKENALVLSVTQEDSTRDIYIYYLDSGNIVQILDGISGYALQWIQ